MFSPQDHCTCLNGGSCWDGVCVCPSGYTGTNCETKISCESIWNTQVCVLAVEGTLALDNEVTLISHFMSFALNN